MKNILLLNTYAHGGAGQACRRLQAAIAQAYPDTTVRLLTAADAGARWPFYAERLSFLPYERDRSVRFAFSPANFGKDLLRHPWVAAADVIHLHWINQGLLSIEGVGRLARLGKPLVWTLHDTWAFTGGCHIFQDCDHFRGACGHCPYLKNPGPSDLSHQIWRRKKQHLPTGDIRFVTCSEWLRQTALSSSLLREARIETIPNPIDTDAFAPMSEAEKQAFRREKGIRPDSKLILFAAMKISDPHKGFRFLPEALHQLKAQHPDLNLEVLVLGKAEPEALSAIPYTTHAPGLLSDPREIARMYGVADVFATPSMADNLPNTVMEALSCGVPVVGFHTGGIPEMATHRQSGYIARQGDSAELAEGIAWVLASDARRAQLSQAARQKALDDYAQAVVARRYMELYRSL